MELVKNIDDILENAKRFDSYLKNSTASEKEFALDCLARGKCFVVIKQHEKYKFYPSKYIGYKNNSESNYNSAYFTAKPLQKEKYRNSSYFTFDGRVSNKAINKILGCTCTKDIEMSEKFIDYCHSLGLKGSDKKKFWLNIIEQK